MGFSDHPEEGLATTFSVRIAIWVYSALLFAIAGWMWWIMQKFVDGRTWWDFIVRVVLGDLILSIFLFGIALILHAAFPRHTKHLVAKTGSKLSLIVSGLLIALFGALFFVSLVQPVLLHWGILS